MIDRLDEISVKGLLVDCVMGVYRSERISPQTIQVDVTAYLDTRAAAIDGRIAHTIDYARLCGNVRFLLERGRFQTMEAAADAILRLALAPSTADAPQVRPVRAMAQLTKPTALDHGAVPSIRIVRQASEFQYDTTETPWGVIETVSVPKAQCKITRSRIRPGLHCELAVPAATMVHELVLGSKLAREGELLRRGTAFEWPPGVVRRYFNTSKIEQSWLSIDVGIADNTVMRESPSDRQDDRKVTSYYPEHDDAEFHG